MKKDVDLKSVSSSLPCKSPYTKEELFEAGQSLAVLVATHNLRKMKEDFVRMHKDTDEETRAIFRNQIKDLDRIVQMFGIYPGGKPTGVRATHNTHRYPQKHSATNEPPSGYPQKHSATNEPLYV